MDNITLTVNGVTREASGVLPYTTLLSWLRDLGLTSCKEGCAEGECGACAVLVACPAEHGGTYLKSVNACLVLLPTLNGGEVVTAEGLGRPGKLHPVQRELAVRGGSQCGYCTPGFVISMAAEYYREGRPSNSFDIHALSGNLCRCTGYRPIQDAALSLGIPQQDDPLVVRLIQPPPTPQPMQLRTQAGEFYRPQTLTEALERLASSPGAQLLAGGTDWVVDVNLHQARAPVTIALDGLTELRTLLKTTDYLEIGAGLSLSEIEQRLAGSVPLLAEWFPLFASRLIRNSATLGGNLGTASPIGDSPPLLLALDARVVLVSASGEREVPLPCYFTAYRQTQRQPSELIRAVRIPLPLAPLAGFYKIAKRRFDDISSVAVGIALDLDKDKVRSVRIGLGGVAATPLRAYTTEEALIGKIWNEQTVHKAARVLRTEGTPLDDHRASAAYRSAMLGQTLLKFYFEKTMQGIKV